MIDRMGLRMSMICNHKVATKQLTAYSIQSRMENGHVIISMIIIIKMLQYTTHSL